MRVVIVGAGPVGLVTAIKIKEKGSDTVTVLEKRPEYTRKQIVMFLDSVSVKALPEKVRKTLWGTKGFYVVPPGESTDITCYLEKGKRRHVSIIISELEAALENYAQDIGILVMRPDKGMLDVELKEPGSIRVIKDGNPVDLEYDRLIGADGSNSWVRRVVMGVNTERYILGTWYGAAFELELTGDRAPIPSAQVSQNRVRMFVSQSEAAYMGLLLRPEEYQLLQGRTMNSFDDVPETVRALVLGYIKFYGYKAKDARLNRVSVFTIEPKFARRVIEYQDERLVALVGEAAFTSNFFSGSGLVSLFKQAIDLVGRWGKEDIVEGYQKSTNERIDKLQANWMVYIPQYDCDAGIEENQRKILYNKGIDPDTLPKGELCFWGREGMGPQPPLLEYNGGVFAKEYTTPGGDTESTLREPDRIPLAPNPQTLEPIPSQAPKPQPLEPIPSEAPKLPALVPIRPPSIVFWHSDYAAYLENLLKLPIQATLLPLK